MYVCMRGSEWVRGRERKAILRRQRVCVGQERRKGDRKRGLGISDSLQLTRADEISWLAAPRGRGSGPLTGSLWRIAHPRRRREIMKRIKCALLAVAAAADCDSRRWMCDPGAAEIRRDDDRRDDRAAPGRLPQGAEMVVLSAVEHLHLPCRAADRAPLACVRLPLLSQGARTISKWPEAEGAEDGPPGQGVRGDFYDRGQGLGRRTDFRADHHWTHLGEFVTWLLRVFSPQICAIIRVMFEM